MVNVRACGGRAHKSARVGMGRVCAREYGMWARLCVGRVYCVYGVWALACTECAQVCGYCVCARLCGWGMCACVVSVRACVGVGRVCTRARMFVGCARICVWIRYLRACG